MDIVWIESSQAYDKYEFFGSMQKKIRNNIKKNVQLETKKSW